MRAVFEAVGGNDSEVKRGNKISGGKRERRAGEERVHEEHSIGRYSHSSSIIRV